MTNDLHLIEKLQDMKAAAQSISFRLFERGDTYGSEQFYDIANKIIPRTTDGIRKDIAMKDESNK